MFAVTAVNKDLSGELFVSQFESKEAGRPEVYAVQWHPEAQQWWYSMGFSSDPRSIRVSQYTAAFLASRLRRNRNVFRSPSELDSQLIINSALEHISPQEYTAYYCYTEGGVAVGGFGRDGAIHFAFTLLIALLGVAVRGLLT